MTGIGKDLRLAFRSLRATPLVTIVAIVSLSLVIGANTAIFSILNSLLLQTLPVRDPERLVYVTDSVLTSDGTTRVRAWSNPCWEQIRQRPELFEAATAWSFTRFNLSVGGETRLVTGLWTDGGFFTTLGVNPLLGRTFSPSDDQRGGGPDGPVAVISYGYWRQYFGGSTTALGTSVRLNGVPFTIVGVMPPEFFGTEVGRTFDFIVPLTTEALMRGPDSVLDEAASNFLTILARLRPGQSIETAATALRAVQPHIRDATMDAWDKEVADAYLSSPFTVLPAARSYSNLRRNYERPVIVLAGVVALVLLIGCVNVANLQLARAIARRHELSMQVALGASRWRVVRQLFAESFVLAASGTFIGIFIAAYGSALLVQQLSTAANTIFLNTSIDRSVLMFIAAVMILTALLFGMAPALRAARVRPADVLRDTGRSTTDRRSGLMGWLVTAQVALSVVLIAAAGLFIQSFASLATRDLGFRAEPVLVVNVDAQRTAIDPSQRMMLYERVREAVTQLPNVADAALSHITPVSGAGFTPAVEIATGDARTRVNANSDVFGNRVSPGWFSTYGTPLIAGRDFGRSDNAAARPVAIVNASFARRFFGESSPIGHAVTIYPNTSRAMSMEIVGVVGDAVYGFPRDAVPPTWYMPVAQFPFADATSVIRLSVRAATESPLALTKSIAAAVATVNPQLALTARSLSEQIDGALIRERLMAQLAGFFGVIGVLLAALGLYGVTSHAASRRRVEIGIRLALGGDPQHVIRVFLGRTFLLVAIGIVAGGVLALWAARFVDTLLYGVPPRDPATLAAAVLLLVTIGGLAAWLPLRRAARLDPASILRHS